MAMAIFESVSETSRNVILQPFGMADLLRIAESWYLSWNFFDEIDLIKWRNLSTVDDV